MPIEGPLRELGIHDVFQLLDLSRKTGTLHVASELRDNEGTVWFDRGKVVSATIRSNPHPLGAMLVRSGRVTESDLQLALARQSEHRDGRRFGDFLVEMGAITRRELERAARMQIEEVVFELMSWREGFFSFVEGRVDDRPSGAAVAISTESLLMEGARRIDEWSRIADQVPHLGVVPVLAAPDDGQGGLLDLLPGEWEVLGLIDGETDLRGIAVALGRGEFEIAKIAYGLVTTGVIGLEQPYRVSASALRPVGDAGPHVQAAQAALREGDAPRALAAARSAQAVDPANVEARLAAARALRRLGRVADAHDELRRAAMHDPDHAVVSYELAWTAAQRGAFDEAVERWEAWLAAQPSGLVADRVRMALDTTRRLRALVEAHVHG